MTQKLTATRKQQIMRWHNWKTQQTHGYSWFVYNGKGKVVSMEVSKAAAIHKGYEAFIIWREQDRLAKIALEVMNWKAPYTKI